MTQMKIILLMSFFGDACRNYVNRMLIGELFHKKKKNEFYTFSDKSKIHSSFMGLLHLFDVGSNLSEERLHAVFILRVYDFNDFLHFRTNLSNLVLGVGVEKNFAK